MTNIRILRLDISGQPVEWLNWQQAVTLYARNVVSWTLGDQVRYVYGGISRLTARRTVIGLHSIVACAGPVYNPKRHEPPLTNHALFRRDQHLCLYCGQKFSDRQLTREHIVPISRGGKNNWQNVVAACRKCNQRKGNNLLDECGMELIALPYAPNHAEFLAITNNNRILSDQMDFLKSQFSSNCRLL